MHPLSTEAFELENVRLGSRIAGFSDGRERPVFPETDIHCAAWMRLAFASTRHFAAVEYRPVGCRMPTVSFDLKGKLGSTELKARQRFP
jgi:hypothetical protein